MVIRAGVLVALTVAIAGALQLSGSSFASDLQWGDVSCDGSVDSRDASLILQYDAGLLGSLPCAQAADVDGSGSANAIDAIFVLQLEAGLIDVLRPDVTKTPTPADTAAFDFALSSPKKAFDTVPGLYAEHLNWQFRVNLITGPPSFVELSVDAPEDLEVGFLGGNGCVPSCFLQMFIHAADTMAPGTYPVTITGTSGALTHSVDVTVIVGAAIFSGQPAPR
ncbi:MAG: dockerin type I repeat-containing protein [Dehalococcoidia bacterium]